MRHNEPEHTYLYECTQCGRTSEQDAREVDHGLVVECCGTTMASRGESYTNEFAQRENRRGEMRSRGYDGYDGYSDRYGRW